MGSTSVHRPKGMTTRKFFEEEFSSATILDVAVVGSVAYMAVKSAPSPLDGQTTVVGVVILMSRNKGHWNFTYKEMDEFCGPNESKCPKRILSLLSPIYGTSQGDTWAKAWRERCREYNAQKTLAGIIRPDVFAGIVA